MKGKKSIIEFEQVNEMLDHDEDFLKEFCVAAISSFQTFQQDFEKHMLARNLEGLRKAGHKIKPVAQMLGIQQLMDEYKRAKKNLQNHADIKELDRSIHRVNAICNQVLDEFRNKID